MRGSNPDPEYRPSIEPNYTSNVDDDPLKILKTRYAKGEITKEEYDEMKKELE